MIYAHIKREILRDKIKFDTRIVFLIMQWFIDFIMNTVHVQGKEVETKKEGEGREIIKWN